MPRGEKKGTGKKYYGRLARVGAVWSVLRQAGHEVIAIPTSFVMARLLTPEDFGVAAASTFFILLAVRLTQFGFNAAIVRIRELRPDHTSTVFVVNLVLGVATFATIALAAPYLGAFLRSADAGRLLPVAALSFLITPFGTVPAALITRRMQFRIGTLADWVSAIALAAVSIILGFKGYGFWSLVYGQLAGAVVRVAIKAVYARWRPSLVVSRQALRELLSFGLGLQAKRLLEYATYNLDTLVVGRVLGMTALGFYDKAFTTMNRLVTRLTLGQAYFRIFSIIHEEPARFRRAYTRLVLTISVLGLPAFAAAIVMAEPLFVLMYGERWLPAVLPFQLLCVGGTLKLLNAYASQANEATGNIWPQVYVQALGTVCVVAGAFVGGRYWGVAGAAAGVAVGMAILTASMQALVRRATGLTWGEMLRPLLPATACTIMIVTVLVLASQALSWWVPRPAEWQELLAQGLTGGIFYTAFVLFSPFEQLADIVTESAHHLLPGWLAHRLDRVRGVPALPPAA